LEVGSVGSKKELHRKKKRRRRDKCRLYIYDDKRDDAQIFYSMELF